MVSLLYLHTCLHASCDLWVVVVVVIVVACAYEVVLVRRPALGIFMFATGSGIDRALGESPPDSVVRMGGVNGSEDAVTMILNGTGDVGMEDVEAAKSRRWVRKGLVS